MVLKEFLEQWNNDEKTIEVRTSGSTGKPKKIVLFKAMMQESARRTCDFLNLKQGDSALLCLFLDHIGGKMMVIRALERGLKLIDVGATGHPLSSLSTAPTFVAMVPLQVFNSLQNPKERELLRNIKHIIIGGSAIEPELAEQLKDFPNAIWSTYGMTETASHIALRRVNGPSASEWYIPFDGIHVSQDEDKCLVIRQDLPRHLKTSDLLNDERLQSSLCLHTNDIVEIAPNGRDFKVIGRSQDEDKCLVIRQDLPRHLQTSDLLNDERLQSSLCLHTNDIVEIAPNGRYFKVIGRKDNVIVSGGIKIQAEEVEALLRQYIHTPFAIAKKKDLKFGEIVVLLVENGNAEKLELICKEHLPHYWKPKEIIITEALPRTENGKIKRQL